MKMQLRELCLSFSLLSCFVLTISAAPWANKIYAGDNAGYVSISTDDGLTWNSIYSLPYSNKAYSVFAVDNHVYVGTEHGMTVSHDGGKSWLSPDTGYVNSVYARNSQVWAVGNDKTLYSPRFLMSSDNGQTWSVILTIPVVTNACTSIFSSGNRTFIGTDGNGLAITDDNGRTWRLVTENDGLGDNRITFISGYKNIIFVGLHREGRGISISEDNGQTWRIQSLTPLGTVTSIFVDDSYLIWGIVKVYVSIQRGGLAISDLQSGWKQWKIITATDGLGTNNVTGVSAIGKNIYTAVNYDTTNTGNAMVISRDGGNTWQAKTVRSYILSVFAHSVLN